MFSDFPLSDPTTYLIVKLIVLMLALILLMVVSAAPVV
ncbi:hypothetical protein NIES21_02900 [Anabaenopsis circularis NIES-21]|uniref:Uncharacterized protein n=1 Tax=Anabaenopsis circularis NIES-21 TaxID=1085406 RepID=A0A1Z4GAH6_9CYAN|nr:hypothetical protein NIES21_02900 [Anabaenopsis circularis NIES-21]